MKNKYTLYVLLCFYHLSVKTVSKTVCLLSKGMATVPTNKSDMYANNRIANCVKISSDMTSDDMTELMLQLFPSKLGAINVTPRLVLNNLHLDSYFAIVAGVDIWVFRISIFRLVWSSRLFSCFSFLSLYHLYTFSRLFVIAVCGYISVRELDEYWGHCKLTRTCRIQWQLFKCIGHDYMAYMDYMDLAVYSPKKAVKLNHSLTWGEVLYWATNSRIILGLIALS